MTESLLNGYQPSSPLPLIPSRTTGFSSLSSMMAMETVYSPGIRSSGKATFAGGLLYREYGFLKRWMMKKIAREAGKDTDTSKNHEYTDWNAVDRFVGAFVAELEQYRTTAKHGSE